MKRRLGPRRGRALAALALLGCNSILDNHPGTLSVPEEAGIATPGPTPGSPEIGGGGTPPGAGCSSEQHLCGGQCVSLSDPTYGCGDPSCAACAITRAVPGCAAGRCVVTTCDPGYADCNAASEDGCETDLSQPETCGSCTSPCSGATPSCTPTGCSNGCTPAAPLRCGETCVDPNTSTSHCGGCGVPCPAVTNATVRCNSGTCAFTCKPSFHVCSGTCRANTDVLACGPDCNVCLAPAGGTASCTNDVCTFTCAPPSHLCGGRCVTNDPTACGPTCTPCPVTIGTTATCAKEACGLVCSPGLANCDANAANGCEASLATDPLNCGACGASCAGQPCVNGVCQAPVPALPAPSPPVPPPLP